MGDEILGFLREARAAALSDSARSRELSLVVTKIDEAILWRQFDLLLKGPSEDAAKEGPDEALDRGESWRMND